jgi:hypothetical protein
MDEHSPRADRSVELTDALRVSLRELISNPLQPTIPPDQAEELIRLGLAARWGDRMVITRAGRRALFPPQDKT